jgi:hypothetical protein
MAHLPGRRSGSGTIETATFAAASWLFRSCLRRSRRAQEACTPACASVQPATPQMNGRLEQGVGSLTDGTVSICLVSVS